MATDLRAYFHPAEYEVVAFGRTSFVTLQDAADVDRLPRSKRQHDRRRSKDWYYYPYRDLRSAAPAIYATDRVDDFPSARWITLDAYNHKAHEYLTHPLYRGTKRWVLLRRR